MIEFIRVPDIGENVETGKVVAVSIKPGDTLAVDDTVIELETDKAVVEIPSPIAGTVKEVLAEEGAELKVGDTIATVETEASDEAPVAEPDETSSAPPGEERSDKSEKDITKTAGDDTPLPPETKQVEKAAVSDRTLTSLSATQGPVPASPSIRRKARELGIDIRSITGSGPGGRITEQDIRQRARQIIESATAVSSGIAPPLPDFNRWGEIEPVSLSTVRNLTARSTAASWQTVAHVTQFDDADISDLNAFIQRHAKTIERAGGKLTLTPILALVCARALKEFPRFNASIDLANRRLILKNYIHIGIAVATERGLLVPVIRDADTKSIEQLAEEVADLANRARNKKITSDEMEGGTFTISNQGGIGGTGFTPIVLWPQAAILGVSRAAVAPRYVDGQLTPRTVLPLSLSYDHRICDGADAAAFLNWVCRSLEQAFTMHLT
jgi:pyruvate dehydrogenase E2 component (dihydrolipoamide acetyltransferase)